MLRNRSHWQLANEHAPERERRLLWQHVGGDDQQQLTPEQILERAIHVEGELPHNLEELAQRWSEQQRAQLRQVIQETLQHPDTEEEQIDPQIRIKLAALQTAIDTVNRRRPRREGQEQEITAPIRAEENAQKAEDIDGKAQGLMKMLTNRGFKRKIKKPEERESWDAAHAFLSTKMVEIHGMTNKARLFGDFESGNMPISVFASRMQDLPPAEQMPALQASLVPLLTQFGNWDDPEIRRQGIAAVQALANYQQNMRDIDAWAKTWDNALDELKKKLDEMRGGKNEKPQEASRESASMNPYDIAEGMGVKFYSLGEFFEAFRLFKDSLFKAYDQYKRLRASELAQKAGEVTPKVWPFRWAKGVPPILNRELENENETALNEYETFLEQNATEWDDLFLQPNGLLYSNQRDGNRFRACLKYAAKHGWLYDFDPVRKTVFGIRLQPGTNLPPTWSANNVSEYVLNLEVEHAQGQNHEKERGKNRVTNYNDIPPMMAVLEDEIKRKNYWAVHGIVERAIEKGKFGETSSWAAAIIMYYFRKDPYFKKYFPSELMDQLGNIGIGLAAWNTTFFKVNRTGLIAYRDGRAEFQNAGELAAAIHRIEEQIRQVDPSIEKDPRRLNQMVGQVLASQEVTVGSGNRQRTISIYDNVREYNKFRNFIEATATTIDPGKTDDDFFNHDNGGSEVVLLSKEGFKKIMDHGNGILRDPQKTNYFLAQLLSRYDRMKKKIEGGTLSPRALEQYTESIRQRLDDYTIEMLNDSRAGKLAPLKSTSHLKGKPLWIELYRRGLISLEPIVRISARDGKTFTTEFVHTAQQNGAFVSSDGRRRSFVDEMSSALIDERRRLETVMNREERRLAPEERIARARARGDEIRSGINVNVFPNEQERNQLNQQVTQLFGAPLQPPRQGGGNAPAGGGE